MDVAGQLYDMALIHDSPHGRMAYKRAAQAVLELDEPLDEIAAVRPLREIPMIGPASERVIQESLENGTSRTVAAAVQKSGREGDVRAAHALRTNFLSRANALRALRSPARGAVGVDDYRGDLQMHTEWSDGAESLAGMAKAAIERGYEYIGVSDHSYGLRIARGMSMADATRQHRQIDTLNEKMGGAFRILKGIEANIPASGGVDMTPEELALFELVLAAPHSQLRKEEDQTERMLATVRHPSVHVLAHPRGRQFSRRGVLARWDEIFEEAAERGVAIEIDGDPNRQDLDHTLARKALQAGCVFALDSDAHSGAELAYAEIALAHARLAKIPPSRILNTWPVAKLLDWAKRKRSGRRRTGTISG